MFKRAGPTDRKILKRFFALRNLPGLVLDYVAKEGQIESCKRGKTICVAEKTDNFVTYLLDGKVKLITLNGGNPEEQVCLAGSERSALPLAKESPNEVSATALTKTTLLKFPRELYDSINHLPSVTNDKSQQAIELTESDGIEAEIFWSFHTAIKEDRLELPSMPDIATRIARATNSPNTDSDDIANIIRADPTVAARIISVVNSAAYRGMSPIDNLNDAITRLGRTVTHNLVTSFALGNLFNSRSNVLRKRMLSLWQHSSFVAPICHELAKYTPGLNPDQALLCGLVHDIGALPIINAARERKELLKDPKLLEKIIVNLSSEVSAMVLRKWSFPDYFIRAALHAEDWLQDMSEKPDYVDLVVVAQLHSYVGTKRMSSLPRLDLVPAFHKLALGKLTPRHSLDILEKAKDSIREMQDLLAM